ncbi:MAG: PQQ-binding-like beta-propeller repeat protein [Pseudomonadota bacterium]
MRSLLSVLLLICLSLGLYAAEAAGLPIIVPTQGVTAFDSETLKPRWKVLLGETIHSPVSAAGVVIVSNSSGVTAIESESGAIRWRLNDRADVFSAVVNNDLIYLASKGGWLQAVDLHEGHRAWQTHFTGWVYPPAVSKRQLYTGGSAGKLWALDQTNGSLLWERNLEQEMVYSPVVVQGGSVIVTTFAREVLAFSPTGSRLWKTELPAVVSSPAVLNGLLVFSGLDQNLYGVDSQTGELLWSRPLGERLQTSMVVNHEEVISILDDGRLVSVDGQTGDIQELFRVSSEPIIPPYVRGDRIILFLRSLQEPEVININRQTGETSIKEI